MIKNWLQFISESQQLELFKDEIFPYTQEDILDYLCELEDARYMINIEFGWLKNNKFNQKIYSYDVEPCIEVSIHSTNFTNSENVTSCLSSFIKRAQSKAKSVKIYDEDGNLDIQFLHLKGGIFLNERPEDSQPDEAENYHDIQLSGIYILLTFNRRLLSDKDVMQFYEIRGEQLKTNQGQIDCLSYNERGEAIFEVMVEDLARWATNKNDSYVDFILNPDKIWDHYLGSFGYTPDHHSFFYYHLDKENIELLLKVCIQEDGWEQIKLNLKDQNITQEEFIQIAIKDHKGYDNLGRILEELPKSEEIYNDIRRTYVEFEEQAKAQEDLDEIISEFDELIENEFKTSIISKQNYQVKKTYTNKQGEKKEYDHEFQTYKLIFNLEWLIELDDAETIFNAGTTYNILSEYSNNIYSSTLNPHFSDYANVDDKEFNKEVKSQLNRYLKKNI